MKTLFKSMALAALCIVGASSCGENEPEKVPATPKWEAQQTSLDFKFGEAKSVAMTAENIDYVNVVSYPQMWTVNAVVTSIDIKAPSGDKDGFDLKGNIELEGVSRELDQKVKVTIAVSVDPESLEAKLEITSDVKYTQVFSLGESKTFQYEISHVKELDLDVPFGWAAVAENGTLTVTAPDEFSGNTISGTVKMSGTPLAGSSSPQASFQVALPAYRVDSSQMGDARVCSILDEDGNGIGIVTREWVDLDNANFYVYFVMDNAYTDPVAVDGTDFIGYDGTILSEEDGDFLPTTTVPYTVKDVDGNEYLTVYANGKLWMDSNYRCLKFADGTEIVDYHYPELNESLAAEYGVYYQRAITGATSEEKPVQGVCPDGWHLPEVADFVGELVEDQAGYNCDPTLFISLGEKRPGLCIAAFGSVFTQGRDRNAFFATYGYEVLISTDSEDPTGLHLSESNPLNDLTYYPCVRCVKDTLPFIN